MAACGTNGGYHAHHRRDEEPCDACKDAHAADRRSRRIEQRAQAADTFLEALDTVPPIEGELDELEDLQAWGRSLSPPVSSGRCPPLPLCAPGTCL